MVAVYDAPSARCPVCKRAMHVRAGQTKDDGHFYHVETEIYCSTKKPAARPYLKLFSMPIDHTIVSRNKDFVKDNMQKIYSCLLENIPFLDFLEFIKILKEAKRLNIYAYSFLKPEHIPYVFVTLINFLPKYSYKERRELKFIFFYEDAISSFNELWIDNGFASKLYRISYIGSKTNKVTPIDITIDYLDKSDMRLTEKQLNWCIKAI